MKTAASAKPIIHQWSYLKSTIAGENQIGPVSESDFLGAITEGKIKPKTKVYCATRTKGQWAYASSVPMIRKKFDELSVAERQSKIAANENVFTKKNAIILTVALVGIFGLLIAIMIGAMSEPTLPPSNEIVEPIEPIETNEAVEVVEKTPLGPEQLKAKEKIEELESDFERFNDRRGLQILHRGGNMHPGDFIEQLAYFWAERNKPILPPAQPASTGQRVSTGTLGGARSAGMELAKKRICEEGVFPTNAKYPWANVKAELMRDTGQFKVYRVTGTVESGSRSAKWESHILSDYEVYACTAVYVNGIEIWSLPD